MAGKNNSLFWTLAAILSILIIYYVRMYYVAPHIFSFKFSPTRLEQYFKSQDITRHVTGRVYLSDEDIHMAAGYLYVYGFDPTAYNFQHPPLIKYFYGYTTRLFGNPYLIQLFFGSALLALTYFAALLLTKKSWVAYLACLFLIADPVFTDVSQHALLDLGQSVFAFAYVVSHLYMPGSFILQGILLGAFAASKFWSTALFFIAGITTYNLLRKKFMLRQFTFHLLIAFLTFCAVYIHSFFVHAPFNILFFQLKTLKYWFNHSVSSVPGDAIYLFMTGQHHMWWQNNDVIKVPEWPLLWPLTAIALLISTYVYRKKISPILFISLLPLLYVAYISFQAPYMRYFILILPYCYIILFNTLSLIIKSNRKAHS